ncbi:MAG: tetratricopeptide repeat protein [Candidatus Latescibacterota bacterium]|nr:MAG: tetratricopeptide repeat protein [Candidatus Latescibacterota bacterium]
MAIERERRSWALVGVLFALYGLICAASFLPHVRLWGINHLAFYSLPIRLVALAAMGIVFVPAVARRVYAAAIRLPTAFVGRDWQTTLLVVAVSLMCALFFWYSRSSTNLLGDGQLIAQSLEAAHEGNTIVAIISPRAIWIVQPTAFGAMTLFFWATRVATGVFGVPPVDGIRLLNCLLGGLFVFVFLRTIRSENLPSHIRPWVFFLILFSGTMQLFFGYVEYYAPVMFLTLLYVIGSYRVLRGHGGISIPLVLFAIALFTHAEALLFAPSLVFVVAWRYTQNRHTHLTKMLMPSLIAVTVLAAIVAGKLPKLGDYYLPLLGTEASYGVLSPAHWADMANALLLHFPTLPLFVTMALMCIRTPRPVTEPLSGKVESRDAPRVRPWFSSTAEWHFAVLIVVPCVLLLFLFDPEIGMARDWDLFAVTVPGLMLLAFLSLGRLDTGGTGGPSRAIYTSPALVMTVILGAAWFGINASPNRTIQRFESVLTYETSYAGYAYETLAIHYEKLEQLPKAIRAMEKATEASPNPRLRVGLAKYHRQSGDLQRAIDILHTVLEKHPGYAKALYHLITSYEQTRQYDKIVEVAREGIKHNPQSSYLYLCLGAALLELGQTEEGIGVLRHCRTLNPPSEVAEEIDARLRQHERKLPE